MTYDIDFRYRRALAPEGLTTVETCALAVTDAIRDARNAGLDPDGDPAVAPLARHLGRIASQVPTDAFNPGDQSLRQSCFARIADLQTKPMFVVLARRGTGHDKTAHDIFVSEIAARLRSLAALMGETVPFDIRKNPDDRATTEITYWGPDVIVTIASDTEMAGREITYQHRHRPMSRSRTADIAELLDVARFAGRLIREFHLEPAPVRDLV